MKCLERNRRFWQKKVVRPGRELFDRILGSPLTPILNLGNQLLVVNQRSFEFRHEQVEVTDGDVEIVSSFRRRNPAEERLHTVVRRRRALARFVTVRRYRDVVAVVERTARRRRAAAEASRLRRSLDPLDDVPLIAAAAADGRRRARTHRLDRRRGQRRHDHRGRSGQIVFADFLHFGGDGEFFRVFFSDFRLPTALSRLELKTVRPFLITYPS